MFRNTLPKSTPSGITACYAFSHDMIASIHSTKSGRVALLR